MRKTYLLALLVFTFFAFAREPNITVSLSKYKCAIGDKVGVEVKVVSDTESKVEFSLEKPEDENIVVSDVKTETKKLPENMKITSLSFKIQSFKLGTIEAGKVKIKVDGKEYEKPIPKIEVVSILPQNKKDINPLKPQSSIKPDYSYLKKYAEYGLAGLLLLAVLFFILKKLIAKIKGMEKEEPEKEIVYDPPCIEVKNLVSNLLSKTYLKEGKVKEFFVELSEIAKRFLGRVFDFDYDSKTSREVMDLIKKKVNFEEEALIRDFFEVCDMVKFAKYVPGQSEINATVNKLYQFAESICKRVEKEEGESDV